MGNIIDQRGQPGNVGSENRKKFLRRYKAGIRSGVKDIVDGQSIKDISKARKVKVRSDGTDEPVYDYDRETGRSKQVNTGNKSYRRGDSIDKPRGGQQGGRGTQGDDTEEEFSFELTKQEFIDAVFHDMGLPDFIKKGITGESKTKHEIHGVATEGTPGKINAKKTMESSLARRIALKRTIKRKIKEAKTDEEREYWENKKVPFIEDKDLRYNRFEERKYPVRKAVMVMLMDVSASMRRKDKDMAKRFFLLLYLFLDQYYDEVDMRFITYTEKALEVSEEEFFYSKRTGGTSVAAGLEATINVLNEYDESTTNMYLAHVSDGDLGGNEVAECYDLLVEDLMPKLQYAAYLLTMDAEVFDYYQKSGVQTVVGIYGAVKERFNKIGYAVAEEPSDVFEALRGLFNDE